jgi:hypothetical protein
MKKDVIGVKEFEEACILKGGVTAGHLLMESTYGLLNGEAHLKNQEFLTLSRGNTIRQMR